MTSRSNPVHLLHCIDEFLRLNWRWINHLFDERPLTVGVGSRHMHEHFQPLESLAQFYHPPNCQQVHVHSKPEHYVIMISISLKCFTDKLTTTVLWPFVQDYHTWLSWYQKKNSPTYTYPDHQPSFISFLHLLQSTATSPFNLCACQSFCTTSLQVLFGILLGLEPSTSYSTHFFLRATA